MIVFHGAEEVPADFGPSAVAIGKFDGVHIGHRAVIERLKADAEATGARSVAVTFDRNPLALLHPELCPASIVDLDRKLELLAELGPDATLLLAFDEQLADVEAEDFVRTYLVETLQATTVLVGADFRFGRGGAGDTELLRALGDLYGFSVDVIGDVTLKGTAQRVSSSGIRRLLDEGDVTQAAQALGRPVEVRGEVVHGLKRGRELGFPTANLAAITETTVPADGIYAGWLHDRATGIRYPAAISVGTNPTFDDVPTRVVEAHVIDRDDLDLYGHEVTVLFTTRLREMTAFEGVEALVEQIAVDVAAARAALGVV